jgi:hypothetical protein
MTSLHQKWRFRMSNKHQIYIAYKSVWSSQLCVIVWRGASVNLGIPFNTLNTEICLNNILKFSSYLAENTTSPLQVDFLFYLFLEAYEILSPSDWFWKVLMIV